MRSPVATAIAFALQSAAFGADLDWHRDYAAARMQAEATGRILFISVHTTWCNPCKEMHRTTLRHPRVVETLAKRCVCLSLDGDADAQLVRQMSVRVFPTEIFASPDGRVLEAIEGFADSSKFLGALERALTKQIDRRSVAERAKTSPPSALASSTLAREPSEGKRREAQLNPATDVAAATARNDVHGNPQKSAPSPRPEPRAELGGYCPVTMIERAELVRGNSRFAAIHEGKSYWLRGEREKALFLGNPKQYLPAESGRCVVTWQEKHQWRQGTIEFPAMFEEQLYLFPSADVRDKFLRDPEKYVQRGGSVIR